uniref:Uncharacterized protein n=1 Tax=Opuntia streptacantha TaxID=393608 RepID=A0A7C9CMC7_OPUST
MWNLMLRSRANWERFSLTSLLSIPNSSGTMAVIRNATELSFIGSALSTSSRRNDAQWPPNPMSKSMMWMNSAVSTASRIAWLAANVEKRETGEIPENAL